MGDGSLEKSGGRLRVRHWQWGWGEQANAVYHGDRRSGVLGSESGARPAIHCDPDIVYVIELNGNIGRLCCIEWCKAFGGVWEEYRQKLIVVQHRHLKQLC